MSIIKTVDLSYGRKQIEKIRGFIDLNILDIRLQHTSEELMKIEKIGLTIGVIAAAAVIPYILPIEIEPIITAFPGSIK